MPDKKKKKETKRKPRGNTTKSTSASEIVRDPDGKFAKGQSAYPANLWKPGQSGNPEGRPKDLTKKLRQQLSERVPNDPHGRTYAQLLIEAGVKRAIARSDILFKEIFDRMDGKLTPDPEDQGLGGGRVEVIIMNSPRPGDPVEQAIPVRPVRKALPDEEE